MNEPIFYKRWADKATTIVSALTIVVLLGTLIHDHWVLEPRIITQEQKMAIVEPEVQMLQTQNAVTASQFSDIKSELVDIKSSLSQMRDH